MRKYRLVASLVLLIAISINGLFGTQTTQAQEGGKQVPAPNVPPGRVFDSYPHPNTRGALPYSLADKWDKTNITYQFNNCPTLADCGQAQNAVRQAFNDWASVSVLTFAEVQGGADIEIQWAGAEQDMGPGSDVLGFAYFPSDGGDFYINDSIAWEFGTGSDSDLYLTAAHEIGHALGLDHSSDPASLMYPTATELTTGIASDDIQAIQALYGSPDGTTPPLVVDNTPVTVPSDGGSTDSGTTDSSTAEGTVAVDGVLDDSTPYEIWEFDVESGETLVITATRMDGDLMPYVGIMTYDESEVLAESDPAVDSASVTLTFPEAGTYVLVVGREGMEQGSSQGGYVLSFETISVDGVQPATTDNGYNSYVEIYNFAGVDLCELYISPSDSEDWGNDWLGGEPLADGEGFSTDLSAGEYDSFVYTCDGYEIEGYYLNIGDGSSIEIYSDAVTVYP